MKEIVAKKLGSNLTPLLDQIIDIADSKKVNIYLVGGFVRDILLNRENLDIDLVVEGDGVALAKKIASKLSGKITIHERFGTAVIKLPDGFKIDIASTRSETYKSSGVLPTIALCNSIEEDLKRRDFTINSIALRLNGQAPYTLIDPFNGDSDIKSNTIRVLHNKSFIDDPTRILRAIRFEQRFSFNFSENTEKLLRNALDKNSLKNISYIRFYNEFELICLEEDPCSPIDRIGELGLLSHFNQNIKYDRETKKQFKNIKDIVSQLKNKDEIDLPLLFLTPLLVHLSEKNIRKLCRRFSIPEKRRTAIIHGRMDEKDSMGVLSEYENLERSVIYNILIPFAKEYIIYMAAKTDDERTKDRLLLYLNKLSKVKIEISGKNIIKLGIKEGEDIGDILATLIEETLDGNIKGAKEETDFVKNKFL